MMTDRHYIQQLLDRFMAGSTTEAEEQMLADYFNTATDVPDEWEAYAILFCGLRQQATASNHSVQTVPMKHWLSIAALVLVIFGLTWYYLRSSEPTGNGQEMVTEVRSLPANQGIVTDMEPVTSPVVADITKPAPTPSSKKAGKRYVQKLEPRKQERNKAVEHIDQVVTVSNEPSELTLLDIDMTVVQQQGEDLRLAMAVMNQELLETE